MRYTLTLALILVAFTFLPGLTPPQAPTVPYTQTIHGITLTDPWNWLKDKTRTNQQVRQYLDQENSYADSWMASTNNLRTELYNEMFSRIPQNDVSLPYVWHNTSYYSRDIKGKQYPQLCRRPYPDGQEEIYFDINAAAKGHSYYSIGDMAITSDHKKMLYCLDTNGSEVYSMYLRDLTTGKDTDLQVTAAENVIWAADNQTYFYVTADSTGRSNKMWRKAPGQKAQMLYQELDARYYLGLSGSMSEDYIFAISSSKTTTEIRLIDAHHPLQEPMLVQPRQEGMEYYFAHHDSLFYVLSNDKGPNNRIAVTLVSKPQMCWWKDWQACNDSVYITGFTVTKSYIAVTERANLRSRIKLYSPGGKSLYTIASKKADAVIQSGTNVDWNTNTYRYTLETFTNPYAIYEYNLNTGATTMLKQRIVPNYKPDLYESQRVFAQAADGTMIPISMVYRKSMHTPGKPQPLLLYGYGAYGDSSFPWFSSSRLSLLDRGFIWAIAHVRGGSEYGKRWHNAGRMENKINTFTDFTACANYLEQKNYTSPSLMCAEGASAGGLLMGAIVNMRPDLFAAVLAEVPFVDVLNTMLDPGLSATVSEYEEWGNPQIKTDFERIRSWCPYQNVKRQPYPAMLVTAGYNDPRVNYWEPAKLVAKMRTLKLNDSPLLLKTYNAGHAGASGRYDYLHELAYSYAFLLRVLGIAK